MAEGLGQQHGDQVVVGVVLRHGRHLGLLHLPHPPQVRLVEEVSLQVGGSGDQLLEVEGLQVGAQVVAAGGRTAVVARVRRRKADGAAAVDGAAGVGVAAGADAVASGA